MSYWTPDGLTPVERQVQGMQVREVRCAACRFRTERLFDDVWGCSKDLIWRPGGRRCKAFKLDPEA